MQHAGVSAVLNGNDAATRAADVTQDCSLCTKTTECLLFDTFDEGNYFLVRVREKYTAACGGPPGVSPSLFFMKIRKHDGHILTTAYDGQHYRSVKPRSSAQKPAKD